MANEEEMSRAQAVQAKYQSLLMSKPNVVGVGVGIAKQGGASTGKVALVVMVAEKIPIAQLNAADVIPKELDGIRVDVQATGTFTAG